MEGFKTLNERSTAWTESFKLKPDELVASMQLFCLLPVHYHPFTPALFTYVAFRVSRYHVVLSLRHRQSRLGGVEGRVAEVRKQYAREYRERRRLFNIVQVQRGSEIMSVVTTRCYSETLPNACKWKSTNKKKVQA